MYEITVKWPGGKSITRDGYSEESARDIANVLWVAGADDVIVRCTCGECETCIDRAIFESGV